MPVGPMLLGCVADDLTGATDLGDMLVRAGLRTTLWIGPPDDDPGDDPGHEAAADSADDCGAEAADDPGGEAGDRADAVIVALRSRTIAVAEAVEQSLWAQARLRAAGAERIYFKVCSTFDSTDDGNIGPVADALADRLDARLTLVCPAFPANQRTVYAGHLFVGDELLSRSSMRHHPLTPMTDPDLVAVLGRQSRRPVGLLHLSDVRQGAAAVEARLHELDRGRAASHVIADATADVDLDTLGRAVVSFGLPLCVGGSGLAGGIARALRPSNDRPPRPAPPAVSGPAVIVSGSCSAATRAQVAAFHQRGTGLRLDVDPRRLPAELPRLEAQLTSALADGPVLVSSTAEPDQVAAVQADLGVDEAATRVEAALGHLARVAVAVGARRVIVAGGETAGAVTAALGLRRLIVGPTIATGVPWTTAEQPGRGGPLALALKSGNFGSPDFFTEALAQLDGSGSDPDSDPGSGTGTER